MNDSRWRGWLVAAAIFVLGVGAGGAGMASIGIRVFRHALQNPNSRGLAERAANRIGADLTKNLKLTPEESAKVQSILIQSAANLKNIRIQATAQAAIELRASAQRLAAVLPSEKRGELYRVLGQRYKRLGLTPPEPDQNP